VKKGGKKERKKGGRKEKHVWLSRAYGYGVIEEGERGRYCARVDFVAVARSRGRSSGRRGRRKKEGGRGGGGESRIEGAEFAERFRWRARELNKASMQDAGRTGLAPWARGG